VKESFQENHHLLYEENNVLQQYILEENSLHREIQEKLTIGGVLFI